MVIKNEVLNKYKIQEIKVPDELDEKLVEYGESLETYLKHNNIYKQSDLYKSNGLIDIEKFNDALINAPSLPRWSYELEWVKNLNDTIISMNIIIHDLLVLRDFPWLTAKPHSVRYTFLSRSFLNEIYRIKEIFDIYIKGYYKGGLITKNEMKKIRNHFYKYIEGFIRLRNVLTHKIGEWTAPEYIDFIQMEAINMTDNIIKNKRTGKKIKGYEILSDLCDTQLDNFTKWGNEISTEVARIIRLMTNYSVNKHS